MDNKNVWENKQWLKNILAKSGTEVKIENQKEKRKMVYYTSLPLIMHNEQPTSQNAGCTQNGHSSSPSPTSASMSPGLHLNINPSQIINLSNNTITLQSVEQSTATHLSQSIPQNFTNSNINGEINYVNLHHQQQSQQQQQQMLQQPSQIMVQQTTQMTTTKNTKFKCEQCNIFFGSKSAHTSHMKSHMKQYQGVDMTSNRNGTNGLTGGVTTQSNGSDQYQCDVCKKTFAVPARLIRHYRTHTGERPFECEFCHKMFSVKENLQVHRRIHTKERPYKCEVCGRAFEHSGKLHRHNRIHTGERPHKCTVCCKTFIQSGQLVIHMRTHTGEKPYKCPVEGCGKGFTCSKQLKVHSRTHTGEKPYHCDICFRDFGYNHVLKLHRVQHYGAKCYKCTICDETFKSKKEMEAHIKGHANDMPDEDDDETRSISSASVSETERMPVNLNKSTARVSPQRLSPIASETLQKSQKHHPQVQNTQSLPEVAKEEIISNPDEELPYYRLYQRFDNSVTSQYAVQNSMNPVAMLAAASMVAAAREREERPPSLSPVSLSPNSAMQPNSNNLNGNYATYETLAKMRQTTPYFTSAAVPEFKPLLGSSDDLVKRVEAALAATEPETPPRSSPEESPDRSSSPEMADRDNNTLPPRKRRLYFNQDSNNGDQDNSTNMRISSVIQFAKAT